MTYEIFYHAMVAKKDIPKLSEEWRSKIKKSIENKLTISPELFGKPLRRSLKGYRKLRVGDYRVIFRIERLTIKIFVIGHRKDVYNIADSR